ncbi:MAG TPA: PfkB family carbohydrate kinase [Chloroflexia bacterium]|nr:PfkB family carbohydrate kinase [Chloroflexia bacterium]
MLDYLAIGHISKDVMADGRGVAGGTATYSALTAQRLGLQAAVVTYCAPEDEHLLAVLLDEGVWVHVKHSPATTTFQNSYDEAGNRAQVLTAQAASLSYDDVPELWRAAPIVHLGPVAQELPSDLPAMFPGCLLGVTPQGWMRSWGQGGRVTHSAWPVPNALHDLPPGALLILSVEDLGHDERLIDHYAGLASVVVITQGGGDALVYVEGRHYSRVPAHQAQSVDPTGAGDVFAAALMVRYSETGDLLLATRFAHAAAAHAIGGVGTSAIPAREVLNSQF